MSLNDMHQTLFDFEQMLNNHSGSRYHINCTGVLSAEIVHIPKPKERKVIFEGTLDQCIAWCKRHIKVIIV